MNIVLFANAITEKLNKKGRMVLTPNKEYFPLIQTPSKITQEAAKTGSYRTVYRQYVKNLYRDDPDFADDHFKELYKWEDKHRKLGNFMMWTWE